MFKKGQSVVCVSATGFGAITVGQQYIVEEDSERCVITNNDNRMYDYPSSNFKAVNQPSSEQENKMLHQVGLVGIKRSTSETPEKRNIIVPPHWVEASGSSEAILLMGVNNAEVIAKAKYDSFEIFCKN